MGVSPKAYSGRVDDLLTILRRRVAVTEVQGWRTRRRPGTWAPVGVMVHHTAGTKSLNVIVSGRSDLAGPLANLHVPKHGAVNLVSAGRCNHAGTGARLVLDETRRDVAPSGDAVARGLLDGPVGNGLYFGFECENLGNGVDPWPVEQLETIARAAAAVCHSYGWSASRVVAHREWTRRKPDPRGFSMDSMRARVDSLLRPPTPQGVTVFDPPLVMQPIVSSAKDPQRGGSWLLGKDGSVYAFDGARYLGGPNGKPYFVGRTAHHLEVTADGRYAVVASSGEQYGPGF